MMPYTIDENGCHIFDGCKGPKGYGHVRRKNPTTGKWRTYPAHRWQWIEKHGDLPPDISVCHSCDNPPCINLEHLWIGTNKDNHNDKMAKGRARGPNSYKTHCKNGHEFTPENTRQYAGRRHCRTCNREYMQRRRGRGFGIDTGPVP